MSTYLYELSTTGAISFADFCVDQSANTIYTRHISETTQIRANLRGALKEIKRTDGEKDNLNLVKVFRLCEGASNTNQPSVHRSWMNISLNSMGLCAVWPTTK